MDLIGRLATRLLETDVALDRDALTSAAEAMLAEEAPLAHPDTATAVTDAIVGLGPIERLLRDDLVSDVLVNGPDEIWVERSGVLQRSSTSFADDAAIRAAVERVIAPLGLRLDHASPVVDARLADGSRLHAVIPPVAVDGPVVAVRRFTQAVVDLAGVVDIGGITAEGADLLAAAVAERKNIIVSGGTGSGKTTLLNVLSKEIPVDERIVTIEDAAELRLSGHVVRLEARAANAEGAGAMPLRLLVRHALRLRPDRIIVGEVRGPEALDMVQAMSTGHDGSLSTVHASSPEEAMWRIEALALSDADAVGAATIRRQLWSAVDLVVQTERHRGRRFIRSIGEVGDDAVAEVYSC